MQVTKTHAVSARTVHYQNHAVPLQGSPAPHQERRFDQFTEEPAAPCGVQDFSKTAEQVADALHKQYPGVTFTFTQLGDCPEDIAQFVVSAGSGVHLVMDPDMLEWMAQGEEAWTQGLEMIGKTLHDLLLQSDEGAYHKGAVIADDGEIIFWTAKWEKPKTELEKDFEYMTNILEQLDETCKQKAEQQKKLKLEQKRKLNYQMGRDMARLAKGASEQDVRTLISSMYANRQRIAVNSSYDRKEVQMALAQMDYVIGRARAKIRHLKDEGDMQLRIKKAEKRQEEKRRIQLEQELKNRRRSRIARERAGIHEKLPDLPGLRNPEEQREARVEAMLGEIISGAVSAEWTPAVPTASVSTIMVSAPTGGTVEVAITPMA